MMRKMPAEAIDFILTDPPYLVNYRDLEGRTIHNDRDDTWLKPAMAEAYTVLKQNRLAIMFYGWTRVDSFFAAWREEGFQPVGHMVFRKAYSSKSSSFATSTSRRSAGEGQAATAKATAWRCNCYAL